MSQNSGLGDTPNSQQHFALHRQTLDRDLLVDRQSTPEILPIGWPRAALRISESGNNPNHKLLYCSTCRQWDDTSSFDRVV